jgi:hypothetical protein
LKVGKGSGDLPSIPGLTALRKSDNYETQWSGWMRSVSAIVALIGAAVIHRVFRPS